MRSREPAGWEREGGSSAESSAQAWAEDGPGGKTSGTVRGSKPRGTRIRVLLPQQGSPLVLL